jgi:hypothetical protein
MFQLKLLAAEWWKKRAVHDLYDSWVDREMGMR